MDYILTGVAALILLVALAFRSAAARDRETLSRLQAGVTGPDRVFHPADLAGPHLPPVVERYLTMSLPPGLSWPRLVRVRQEGEFRLSPDKPWLRLQARQFYTLSPPGFVWQARIRQAPGLWLTARDSYLAGRGNFVGRLFGLIPVVRGAGREVDISSLIRYLSEAAWYPLALVPGNGCRWEAAGPDAARATLTDCGLTVSGVFSFNAAGEITRFFTTERYQDQKGRQVLTDWTTEYFDYETFQGVRLPTLGTATWNQPEGPFTYARIRVTGVEFLAAG